MAKQTFYFYDLETSGISAKTARVMQFAGQRTDLNLQPIGEPDNILVKLPEDVLPDPRAVLVHGITPQKAASEGLSEAEFFRYVSQEVFTPDTIAVGFNTIRFDDEFMRFGFWRNFIDPYEWAYKDNRSRWDIIDVVRMTRALRPEGLNWPVVKGKNTNRLEELTKANKINHEDAHDALADVTATIEIARLLKKHQPKLFDHLFSIKDKAAVTTLLSVKKPQLLVHSSGMLSSEFEKTSIVVPIAEHPTNPSSVLVYDLRFDPSEFAEIGQAEVKKRLFGNYKELEKAELTRLPVKGVFINRSPALAPTSVLDEASQQRIGLDVKTAKDHYQKLQAMPDFVTKIVKAHEDSKFPESTDPEQALYDGFVSDGDKKIISKFAAEDLSEIYGKQPEFKDERLQELWFRFRARNAPETLDSEEKARWQEYKTARLTEKLSSYGQILDLLSQQVQNTKDAERQYILEELYLYGQSLADLSY